MEKCPNCNRPAAERHPSHGGWQGDGCPRFGSWKPEAAYTSCAEATTVHVAALLADRDHLVTEAEESKAWAAELQRQLTNARAELATLSDGAQVAVRDAHLWQVKAEEAQQQAGAMREALREITRDNPGMTATIAGKLARAALAPDAGKGWCSPAIVAEKDAALARAGTAVDQWRENLRELNSEGGNFATRETLETCIGEMDLALASPASHSAIEERRRERAICAALAKCDPVYDYECALCGVSHLDRFKDGPEKHAEDCPWRMVRASQSAKPGTDGSEEG